MFDVWLESGMQLEPQHFTFKKYSNLINYVWCLIWKEKSASLPRESDLLQQNQIKVQIFIWVGSFWRGCWAASSIGGSNLSTTQH